METATGPLITSQTNADPQVGLCPGENASAIHRPVPPGRGEGLQPPSAHPPSFLTKASTCFGVVWGQETPECLQLLASSLWAWEAVWAGVAWSLGGRRGLRGSSSLCSWGLSPRVGAGRGGSWGSWGSDPSSSHLCAVPSQSHTRTSPPQMHTHTCTQTHTCMQLHTQAHRNRGTLACAHTKN